jgi:ParB-like chromosome segregation protein Spo0J
MKWNGPDALKPLLIPVGKLKTHPRNPRRGDVDRIADSLTRFGQMRPAPYQESTTFIVAGNHTYRAAVEKLDWTHFAAVPADLTDEEALAYVIADNRTADAGGYDDVQLGTALRALVENGKIAGTGYTKAEIDAELGRILDHGKRAKIPDAARTAAAAAAAAAPPLMKDLVLGYDPERYVELTQYVRIVQRERSLRDAAEVVFECVRDAARAEE